MDPLASLTVTYLVAAVASGVLYFVLKRGDGDLVREYGELNWAPFVLGVIIVGLEVGFIYAYKAGWQISTAALAQNSVLAVLLLIIGALFYGEAISFTKIIGMIVCLAGLVIMNR